MTIEDRFAITELLEEYGSLLTDKQRDMLGMYCEMDLSLAEIAQEYGISRQAVRDNMQRAISSLEDYEAKLGVVKLKGELATIIDGVDATNWQEATGKIAVKLEV